MYLNTPFDGDKFARSGKFVEEIDASFEDVSPDRFENYRNYFQFCNISLKKDRSGWMASHFDDVFSSLEKLRDFTNVSMNSLFEQEILENCNSLISLLPVFCTSNNLYVMDEPGILTKVDHAIYVKRETEEDIWGQPCTAIHVVTEKYLLPFMQRVVDQDRKYRQQLIDFHKNEFKLKEEKISRKSRTKRKRK